MSGMSNWALKLGMAGAALWAAGCVPIGDYRKLEQRYTETEQYVLEHKNDMREMERREKVLQLRAREQERQIALLRTRLKKSERLRERLAAQRTVQASAPRPEPAPAPAPPPTFMGLEVNEKTGGLVLENGVMFAPGSATLRPKGKTILKGLADELNGAKYAGSKVRIEGHTDTTPIKRSGHKSNWDLSGKRALAVLHYLEKVGVTSDRLCFAGYAAYKPIDDGKGKKALARNRRVEIILAE